MKKKDGDAEESGEGRKAYRNASEASVGTTESLRDALSGIAPRIREAALAVVDGNEQMEAAERLGAVQFVYWECISDDLLCDVLNSESQDAMNESLTQWFLPDDYDSFFGTEADFQKYAGLPAAYRKIVGQSEDAVLRGAYEIACVGFCSVIDGLLSDFRDVFGEALSPRLDEMATHSEEETEMWYNDDDKIADSVFLVSFAGAVCSFGEDTGLALKEPKTLNRQCITHGRMGRKKTMLDCLKLLRMIWGIMILKEMCEDEWK